MNIIQAAHGRWRNILSQYMDPEFLTGKHGPCPLCGGKDRFRFMDFQGKGTWVCNQCETKPSDGIDLLMRYLQLDFKQASAKVREVVGYVEPDPVRKKKDPRPALDYVSRHALELSGMDPVSQYLKGRGLNTFRFNSLRYMKRPYYHNGKQIGTFDAMIARISDKNMRRKSFHVTYLADGKKADVECQKKIMPADGTISGAAVYLGKGSVCVIAEGIETTLAGIQEFELPGIATISANGMELFDPPDHLQHAIILADNDKTFTGQRAAYMLANKLYLKGIGCEVIVPDTIGNDYLDEVTQ